MPTHRPLPPQIEQFLHDNPQGVLTSFRRNGMPQLSIVTVYPRDGGVGISITETRAKFKNLLRDPRCSVLGLARRLVVGLLVFEGRAELLHSGNADPRSCASLGGTFSAPPPAGARGLGSVHDRIAAADQRVAVAVRPEHIYGSALARMREAVTNSSSGTRPSATRVNKSLRPVPASAIWIHQVPVRVLRTRSDGGHGLWRRRP